MRTAHDVGTAGRGGARTVVGDPWAQLIATIGSSRLYGFYDVNRNLVATAAGLTSWGDVRGSSGFGPTFLPLGASGAGNTGPKLSGSGASMALVSDGGVSANEWAAFGPDANLNLASNPLTFVFIGEITGGSLFPIGIVDTSSGSSTNYMLAQQASTTQLALNVSGGGQWQMNAQTVQPGAGKRIVLIAATSGPAPYNGAIPLRRFEFVGRGQDAYFAGGNHTSAAMYCTLGGWAGGFTSAGLVVKTRAVLILSSMPTNSDRAAIEAFAQDGTVGHLALLQPSTHYVACIGDSITEGVKTSVTQTDHCPSGPTSGTYPNNLGPYPSVVQALANGAGKSVDVLRNGVNGKTLTDFLSVSGSIRTSMFSDVFGAMSNARTSAGHSNIAVLTMGTNDLGNDHRTASAIYADMTAITAAAKAAGAKVVIGTILPRNDSIWNLTTLEAQRLALNTAIRGNAAGADVVVDFTTATGGVFADPTTKGAAGSNTPGDPTSNGTYYFTDQLHPIDAGMAVMGHMVYDALVAASLI